MSEQINSTSVTAQKIREAEQISSDSDSDNLSDNQSNTEFELGETTPVDTQSVQSVTQKLKKGVIGVIRQPINSPETKKGDSAKQQPIFVNNYSQPRPPISTSQAKQTAAPESELLNFLSVFLL